MHTTSDNAFGRFDLSKILIGRPVNSNIRTINKIEFPELELAISEIDKINFDLIRGINDIDTNTLLGLATRRASLESSLKTMAHRFLTENNILVFGDNIQYRNGLPVFNQIVSMAKLSGLTEISKFQSSIYHALHGVTWSSKNVENDQYFLAQILSAGIRVQSLQAATKENNHRVGIFLTRMRSAIF